MLTFSLKPLYLIPTLLNIASLTFLKYYKKALWIFVALSSLSSSYATSYHSTDKEVQTSELYLTLQYAIENIDNTSFSPIRVGWNYDYGIKNSSGLLNTFEHLRSLVSFKTLQRSLPMDIFLTGPHNDEGLNLQANYTFGHYNPEFVRYLKATTEYLLKDKEFIAYTQELVKDYNVLFNLVRLKNIYLLIEDDPESFIKFKQNYQDKLLNKTWKVGDYRNNLPSTLDVDYYWNWSETNYYFWIRRDIDGTKDIWISIINSIIAAYNKHSN